MCFQLTPVPTLLCPQQGWRNHAGEPQPGLPGPQAELLRESCFQSGALQGPKDAIHWLQTGDGSDLGMI